MAINAAAELDVFEIIAKAGPGAYLSPGEISARLPRQHPGTPDWLDGLLSVLASYDVLTCSVEPSTDSDGKVGRKYGAAPVAELFARAEDGTSMAPIAALMTHSKFSMERWYHVKDAVLDGGIAFERAHGMSAFEFMSKEPGFNKTFSEAVSIFSTLLMKGILEAYDGFDNVNLLVDVGGGFGGTLESIVKKHPRIKAINFELPHVVSNAPEIPGVEHVAGDMFVRVPAGAEAILLKGVLRNWGEEQCVKLLNNCREALPDHGKVVVIDHCLPEFPEHTRKAQCAFVANLNMMLTFPGKEKTEKEFESMAKKAGFSRIVCSCSYANQSVLEFYK